MQLSRLPARALHVLSGAPILTESRYEVVVQLGVLTYASGRIPFAREEISAKLVGLFPFQGHLICAGLIGLQSIRQCFATQSLTHRAPRFDRSGESPDLLPSASTINLPR